VALVGRLANAELVGQPQLLVAQEGEAGSEARLEGGLNAGRVDGDDRDSAVGDFSRSLELDQLRQLNLSLGSPRPPVEGEDQRLTLGDVLNRYLALPIVGQRDRRELLTDLVPERH
jgi:hypothetical protein